MDLKKQIEDYIIANKTEEALGLLKKQEGLPEAYRDGITNLQQRNKKLKQSEVNGVLSLELEQSRLGIAIMKLTREIVSIEKQPSSSFTSPKISPKNQKYLIRTILILILGIAIGFLGELMPDTIKESVENAFGDDYLIVYISTVCVTIFALVWLSIKKETPPEIVLETHYLEKKTDNIKEDLLNDMRSV